MLRTPEPAGGRSYQQSPRSRAWSSAFSGGRGALGPPDTDGVDGAGDRDGAPANSISFQEIASATTTDTRRRVPTLAVGTASVAPSPCPIRLPFASVYCTSDVPDGAVSRLEVSGLAGNTGWLSDKRCGWPVELGFRVFGDVKRKWTGRGVEVVWRWCGGGVEVVRRRCGRLPSSAFLTRPVRSRVLPSLSPPPPPPTPFQFLFFTVALNSIRTPGSSIDQGTMRPAAANGIELGPGLEAGLGPGPKRGPGQGHVAMKDRNGSGSVERDQEMSLLMRISQDSDDGLLFDPNPAGFTRSDFSKRGNASRERQLAQPPSARTVDKKVGAGWMCVCWGVWVGGGGGGGLQVRAQEPLNHTHPSRARLPEGRGLRK